jgi:hypothetical protein
MGLSSSSTTKTNDPSPYAKGYITQGANALQNSYGQTAPLASNISQNIAGHLGDLSGKAFGTDPGIGAATGYNTDVLNGKYLGSGNPYLQGQIDQTDNSVTDRVNSTFGRAGRTGSGANSYTLGKALSENENNLRYADYSQERARQGQAVGMAPALNSSQYTGLGAYLSAADAATGLPQQAASSYAGGLGSLLGQYSTQTQTQSPSLISGLGSLVGMGVDIKKAFSDRRLKTGIKKIGEHADGLGRYLYSYVWGGPEHEGVMADEVAKLRPWALGPVIGGYATVNYEAL